MHTEPCDFCDGTGRDPGASTDEDEGACCPECGGDGEVEVTDEDDDHQPED